MHASAGSHPRSLLKFLSTISGCCVLHITLTLDASSRCNLYISSKSLHFSSEMQKHKAEKLVSIK